MSKTSWIALSSFLVVWILIYWKTPTFELVLDDHKLFGESHKPFSQPLFENIFSSQADLLRLVHKDRVYTSVRPLQYLSYWIDHQIGDASPAVLHIHSLILGLIYAGVLLLVSMILFKGSPLGWLIAGLMIFSPINVESIVWISARSDLLASLFAAMSLLYLLRKPANSFGLMDAAVLCLLFIFSILSKDQYLLLPVLLTALSLRSLKEPPKQALKVGLPLFSLLLGYLFLRSASSSTVIDSFLGLLIKNFTKIWMDVLSTILLPFDVALARPYVPGVSWLAILIFTALGFLAVYCLFKKWRRCWWALVFILSPSFIAAATFPVVIRHEKLPDRYLMFASALVFLGLGLLVEKLGEYKKPYRLVASGVLGLFLLSFVIASFKQVPTWRSDYYAYQHSVTMHPEAKIPNYLFSIELNRLNQLERAEEHARRALRKDPNYIDGLQSLAQILVRQKRYKEAIQYADKSQQLNQGSDYMSWYIKGYSLIQLNRKNEGCAAIERSLDIAPNYRFARKDFEEFCQD